MFYIGKACPKKGMIEFWQDPDHIFSIPQSPNSQNISFYCIFIMADTSPKVMAGSLEFFMPGGASHRLSPSPFVFCEIYEYCMTFEETVSPDKSLFLQRLSP